MIFNQIGRKGSPILQIKSHENNNPMLSKRIFIQHLLFLTSLRLNTNTIRTISTAIKMI